MASSSNAVLSAHHHGKGRVRVVKVKRTDDRHFVQQLTVQVLIEGKSVEASYYRGDNSQVLPTDTIKNSIYVLAKQHDFDSIEDFGVLVASYFVKRHPSQMQKASVHIEEENWVRIETPPSTANTTTGNTGSSTPAPHAHAFLNCGSENRFTKVVAIGGRREPALTIVSGFTGLKVLKTTQSSFENFYRDEFTTLPDTPDRLVSSVVSAEWLYGPTSANLDFRAIAQKVRRTLLHTFAGPSDVGTASPAVQFTLFQMGQAVLADQACVQQITIDMPNVHNLPYDTAKLFGLKNAHPHGEIFVPVDDPHGIIKATVTRAAGGGQHSRL